MKNYLIITGASKGLGKALAEFYSEHGYTVYSLARTNNKEWTSINQVACDLADTGLAKNVFSELLESILKEKPTSITLINNAGTLGEVNTLDSIPSHDIEQTVSINYTAPLLFCSIFIDKTKDLSIEKKIRNISSGAAKGAYHGWSVYCSTKAAMDSFTRVVAAEQSEEENPVHALSIYPGVIDTGMQSQIRETTEKQFSDVERFRRMKKEGDLSSPTTIAQLIYKIDLDSTIENGKIEDVREF